MKNQFKNVSIFVTGATGFIGSNLVRELLKNEAKVVILKRPTSSLWRLTDIRDKIDILESDIRDLSRLKRFIIKSKPELVFHLATYITQDRSSSKFKETLETSFMGALNLVSCLIKSNLKAFVNTGTCDEYGDNPLPFNEAQRENPLSPYAASKAAATHYCQMLYKTIGFPVVTLRPFLTYGPYQTGEMLVPYIIKTCLTSSKLNTTRGEQTREFHYVSDIVDGFLLAATNKKAIGEIIDLGTGEEHKVKKVVEMIVKLTNYSQKWRLGDLPYRKNEVFRFYCQGTKAKKLLKWQPKISLKDGLVKTIDWYKQFLEISQK